MSIPNRITHGNPKYSDGCSVWPEIVAVLIIIAWVLLKGG